MINRVPNDRIYEAARQIFGQGASDGREMAFAVADEAAALVFAARTEGCAARVLTHAIRKAYTAATMRRDTTAFGERNRQAGKTLADWGDPQLTQLAGGAVLTRDGQHWGGVGVGGNITQRDAELALLARDLLLHGVSRAATGRDAGAFGDSVGYAARGDLFALTGVTGVDPATGKVPQAPEAEFAQAFANMASFAEAAGGTLDDIANVWTYLGMWDLHPDYVDVWVATFADDASRPSRKTFYYPRTDIQLQCEMVIGGGRRTLEIPGIGHHDPIPMGVVTSGVFTSSGIDGRDPQTGKAPRGVRAQSEMTMQNLQRLLDQASFSRSGLFHVTGLVGERSYADELAAAWKDVFSDPATAPALQLVGLGLPARDLLVQLIARGVAS
jgi:uncharacterized protein GlcG (DUF336 family)/enamine deaminase RidA (YjgF/YER057c/UK114 family)